MGIKGWLNKLKDMQINHDMHLHVVTKKRVGKLIQKQDFHASHFSWEVQNDVKNISSQFCFFQALNKIWLLALQVERRKESFKK